MRARWPSIAAFSLGGVGIAFTVLTAVLSRPTLQDLRIIAPVIVNFAILLGGVLGPLFSLSAFLLIFQTIRDQRQSSETQQFESRLFQLLQYYENIAGSIKTKRSSSRTGEVLLGRDAFYEFVKQNVYLFNLIKQILPNIDDSRLLNVTYLIFFYGVGKNAIGTTRTVLNDHLNTNDTESLLSVVSQKKALYSSSIVYYGGHQLQLSNYFRHLFHVVKYIDETPFLSTADKYRYAKLLRAQLSNYEQAMLLFNAMSSIGRAWIEDKLIIQYAMIRNIPPRFLEPLDPKKHFPTVVFEYEETLGKKSTT